MPRAPHFGRLPPRFRFALNPYAEYRASRCPRCHGLTYPRKFALLIAVQPDELRVLRKTCKYCSKCEFIIAHQDELEAEMVAHFEQTRPDVIGNEYLVLGTVEMKAWRRGMEQVTSLDEMLAHAADFVEYREIEYDPGGWGPAEPAGPEPGRGVRQPKTPQPESKRLPPARQQAGPAAKGAADTGAAVPSERIPANVRPAFDAVMAAIEPVCRQHLNDEYLDLALALARKRPSPLQRGRPEIWACAIVYALGKVNFLFDPSQTPHLRADALCAAFGVSRASASAKARQIQDLFDMLPMDPRWCLPSLVDQNPLVWMLEVNGLIVDIRYLPREAQVVAFEQGLIPYIPADREGTGDETAQA